MSAEFGIPVSEPFGRSKIPPVNALTVTSQRATDTFNQADMPIMGRWNWYALYVKPRHEFVTHGELLRKGVESFLPTIKKVNQWKDRKKLVEFPLFSSYLFVCIPPTPVGFLKVLKARGAVSFVSLIRGIPTVASPDEINSLKVLVENGNEIEIYPYLQPGTRVRVSRGPLKGAEGTLLKKEDRYMFAVNIDLLGRSVAIKICGDDIEMA